MWQGTRGCQQVIELRSWRAHLKLNFQSRLQSQPMASLLTHQRTLGPETSS